MLRLFFDTCVTEMHTPENARNERLHPLQCDRGREGHGDWRTSELNPDSIWVIAALLGSGASWNAAWLIGCWEGDGDRRHASIAVGSDLNASD
jgi:hypothetical protein